MGGATNLNEPDAAAEWAQSWSQRWFLDEYGADRFTFAGISAGWATHVEAYLILLALAKRAAGLSRLGDLSLHTWLKRRGFDRSVRATALRTIRRPILEPRRVASIIEVPTPSMAEAVTLVAAAGGTAAGAAVSDPRAARFVSSAGLRAFPLVVPWREERRLLGDANKQVSRAWQQFAAAPTQMNFGEHDLTRAAVEQLRPLAFRSMPWLAAERRAIELYLTQTAPVGVAIASDQHRIGRLAVAVARKMGIKSVVVQHGMPQARVGYLPVVADHIAAWSDASREWFVSGGTDPEKVTVTGNPRIDRLSMVAATAPQDFRVLLALSGGAPGMNEALTRGVLEALRDLPGAALTVKLHPGLRDWGSVRRTIRSQRRVRVEVLWRTPIDDALRRATVVVVNRSSVVLDAMLAGRPVVTYRVGAELTSAEADVPELDLPTATTPAQLHDLLDRLRVDAVKDAFLRRREVALRRTGGPMDGRSAYRILQLLGADRADL